MMEFDELDLAELVDAAEALCGYSRALTYDEQEGEQQAVERVLGLVKRYREAAAADRPRDDDAGRRDGE